MTMQTKKKGNKTTPDTALTTVFNFLAPHKLTRNIIATPHLSSTQDSAEESNPSTRSRLPRASQHPPYPSPPLSATYSDPCYLLGHSLSKKRGQMCFLLCSEHARDAQRTDSCGQGVDERMCPGPVHGCSAVRRQLRGRLHRWTAVYGEIVVHVIDAIDSIAMYRSCPVEEVARELVK